MSSNTAASNLSSKLSDLLQHLDAVQAAAQISRFATDLACGFGCVRFVLGELSTVKNNVPVVPRRHMFPEFRPVCSVSALIGCCT